MVLNKNDYKYYFLALLAFLSLYPYFIWGYYGVTIIGIFFIFIFSQFLIFNKIKTNKNNVLSFIFIFLLYIIYNSKDIEVTDILWGLVIAYFSISTNLEVVKSFKFLQKLISYILLPGAILWLFHILLGNNSIFHFFTLQPFNPIKQQYEIEFYSYIVSIIPSYDVPSNFYRFLGVFEEPGVVGTATALMLVADKINLKKNHNKLLLLYGVISFSLAFYGLIIIYAIFFKVKKVKNIITILLSLLFITFYAINNDFFKNLIISRLAVDSKTGFAGNNRATDYLNYMFEQWLSLFDLRVFLFGFNDVINDGYSSLKQIPVEKGLLGIIVLSLFMFYLSFKNKVSKDCTKSLILVFLIFLASLYQRPDFFSLYFILIYSYAIINHTALNKKEV